MKVTPVSLTGRAGSSPPIPGSNGYEKALKVLTVDDNAVDLPVLILLENCDGIAAHALGSSLGKFDRRGGGLHMFTLWA